LMTDKEFCTLYGIFMIAWALNDVSVVSYKLFSLQKSPKEDITKVVSMYLKARDCIEEKKYKKAFDIFKRLADGRQVKGVKVEWTENLCGRVLGENGLGYMYAKGLYHILDYKKAVSWFQKAADKDFSMAIFNLGICYEKGLGVNKNMKEANRLYDKAATQGFGPARDLTAWDPVDPNGMCPGLEESLNYEKFEEITSRFYL